MDEKPIVWMSGEVKTPPFSSETRIEAGHYIRLLQQGQLLGMPHSRPMPSIATGCHELRINDAATNINWGIMYYIDADAIVILHIFEKKTIKTPPSVIEICKTRLDRYQKL